MSVTVTSVLLSAAILAGCQSDGDAGSRPPDAWKYTSLQKAGQELQERAEAGEFGRPGDGTWNEAKVRSTLIRLQEKYRSQGYR